MPKAKKAPSLSKFMQASPLTTAATLLLALSVVLNLGVLLFYVLLNHTSQFDTELYNYTRNKICVTDATDVAASYPTLCK